MVKIARNIFILVVGFTLMFRCEPEDLIETDAVLQPYFDIFKEEAELRGFAVDYEAERIEGLLQQIPNSNVQGQCFHNTSKPKKVVIDVDYWNNANESQKEFIIFHELGHCFLDRDHLDESDSSGNCLSIMHSSPQVCRFSLTPANRKSYLDELFSE